MDWPPRDGTTSRVASVSILGCRATRYQTTRARLDFLIRVSRAIRQKGWASLQAVVWPAGYLRSSDWLAPLDPATRRAVIDDSEIGDVVRVAARKLDATSPGCILVVGLDTNRWLPMGFGGDQAATVFNVGGCIGLTRKMFPVNGDTNGSRRSPYLLDYQDAAGGDRFIPLSNGRWSMIGVCYDAFALAEQARGPTAKLRAFRYRTDPDHGWDFFDKGEAARWMETLNLQVASVRPDVFLNPIHGFERPGADRYWQRHGLSTASSALGGAMCVGAAHFKKALPSPLRSPLASANVPESHLGQGGRRRVQEALPIDAFVVRDRFNKNRQALVRLFEA